MPTTFLEAQAGGMTDSTPHTVSESVEEVTNAVNAALTNKLKYVTFTHADDSKQFSVDANDVYDIKQT